jgi:hydrogenase maturation protease
MRSLILGFGNVDRQDDGLAWHVLSALAARRGITVRSPDEEFPQLPGGPDLLFAPQLAPELAEVIAGYDQVCFVDAHTGNIQQDVAVSAVTGGYQASPFTHHLTPATCLAIARALYGRAPPAILVSVRGHDFGFAPSLSARTAALLPAAVDVIMDWLSERHVPLSPALPAA